MIERAFMPKLALNDQLHVAPGAFALTPTAKGFARQGILKFGIRVIRRFYQTQMRA